MSIWGKKDSFVVTGTVTATQSNSTVVGTGTTFTTEIDPGDSIFVSGTKYLVKSVVDDTELVLWENYADTTVANTSITVQTSPKDQNRETVKDVYLISTEESQVTTNKTKGLGTPGWNLYTTYTDTNGNTRHRSETLVPMKVAQADAGDSDSFDNS